MILALDPSTSCTGYAVLTDAGAVVWEQTGTIRPKGEDLPEKLLDLARDVAGLFKTFRMGDDSTIVIERPQTAGGPNRGTYGKQSPMSIAAYGAVSEWRGACNAALRLKPSSAENARQFFEAWFQPAQASNRDAQTAAEIGRAHV